ncbi:MAG: hypothetical protein IPJ77_10060 [Planctomycetes bacterium]|nr:hypothetical protein [Planctomycetota bacterium]
MAHSHFALALASTLLLAACQSVDLDVSDHGTTFFSARARKELGTGVDAPRTFVELSADSVEGTASVLDYRIRAIELGGGIETDFGERFWGGLSGGLAFHHAELDTTPSDFDDETGFGGYAAVEGGFRAASWLLLYARADSTLYFGRLTTRDRIEVGARIPLAGPAALYAGWRQAQYAFDDSDSGLVFDSIDLEASGLVLGLLLDF